jgi:hypothetical protein
MMLRQVVQRETFDAMVGDPALREIVGADALRCGRPADLQRRVRPARLSACCAARPAGAPSAATVARARFLCCERSSWHSTTMPLGRCVMRIAESVLLTCWPPAPEARNVSILQVGRVDLDVVDLVHLRQDRDGGGRGVDAALRFGFGHALHAVRAGFELQPRIGAFAFDARDDFLVAAVFAGTGGDLHAPAFGVRRSARTCGTGRRRRSRLRRRRCRRGFRGRGRVVARIARHQQQSCRAIKRLQALVFRGQRSAALRSPSRAVRDRPRMHLLCQIAMARAFARAQRGRRHRFELGVLARQFAEALRIRQASGSASRRSTSSCVQPGLRACAGCGVIGFIARRRSSAVEQRSAACSRSGRRAARRRAGWRLGACSSLLVSVWARKFSASSASAALRQHASRARASAASRSASPRSAQMPGGSCWPSMARHQAM